MAFPPSSVSSLHRSSSPVDFSSGDEDGRDKKSSVPVLDFAPRRSSRQSRKPMALDPSDLPRSRQSGKAGVSGSPNTCLAAEGTSGLDQIEPLLASDERARAAPYSVLLHPCAQALLQIHAHLAQTEVIGYLGGIVIDSSDGHSACLDDPGRSSRSTVFVLEAFPAKCVPPRVLARTGRNAYSEVEMDPESDVEIRMRIVEKGMSIVGWYHSHPFFSTDPSEVDVENQLNYQTLLFQGSPYVAVICSPFWEELPDAKAKLDMFYVQGDNSLPVRVRFASSSTLPPPDNPGSYSFYERSERGRGHSPGGSIASEVASHQLASLENEAMNLVSYYSNYAKRIDLLRSWRGSVTYLEKLRHSLCSLVDEGEILALSSKRVPVITAGNVMMSATSAEVSCDRNINAKPESRTVNAQILRCGSSCVSGADGGPGTCEGSGIVGLAARPGCVGKSSEFGTKDVDIANDTDNCLQLQGKSSENQILAPEQGLTVSARDAGNGRSISRAMYLVGTTGPLDFAVSLLELMNSIVSIAGEAWVAACKDRADRQALAAKQKRRKKRNFLG
jgi:proteasome lid subunit RPN8/RPN11